MLASPGRRLAMPDGVALPMLLHPQLPILLRDSILSDCVLAPALPPGHAGRVWTSPRYAGWLPIAIGILTDSARAYSSAWLERIPDKDEVPGSNPGRPTPRKPRTYGVFAVLEPLKQASKAVPRSNVPSNCQNSIPLGDVPRQCQHSGSLNNTRAVVRASEVSELCQPLIVICRARSMTETVGISLSFTSGTHATASTDPFSSTTLGSPDVTHR